MTKVELKDMKDIENTYRSIILSYQSIPSTMIKSNPKDTPSDEKYVDEIVKLFLDKIVPHFNEYSKCKDVYGHWFLYLYTASKIHFMDTLRVGYDGYVIGHIPDDRFKLLPLSEYIKYTPYKIAVPLIYGEVLFGLPITTLESYF